MLHNARKYLWLQACSEETFMQRIIPLSLLSGLLLGLVLIGCSPTDHTPKVAEDQREVLKNAEKAAAAIEQSAAKMQQDIDEQSN